MDKRERLKKQRQLEYACKVNCDSVDWMTEQVAIFKKYALGPDKELAEYGRAQARIMSARSRMEKRLMVAIADSYEQLSQEDSDQTPW